MKKKMIFGVASGLLVLGVGSLAVVLKNKLDNETFGLDSDTDFDEYADFDDSDIASEFDMEDTNNNSFTKDELIESLSGMSDDELLQLGILDKDSIDLSSMPINVLSSLYSASSECED